MPAFAVWSEKRVVAVAAVCGASTDREAHPASRLSPQATTTQGMIRGLIGLRVGTAVKGEATALFAGGLLAVSAQPKRQDRSDDRRRRAEDRIERPVRPHASGLVPRRKSGG